jgi:predicted glycosyltransferase
VKTRRRSILIYCGDVLGLGHQRRNTAIASRLVEELPNADVLLLSSLPAGLTTWPDRVDLVKLPSLRKTAGGAIGARSLGLGRSELTRLRQGIIESVAEEFRPDLVLVDHKPTGVWGELDRLLRRWRDATDGPATVLGLRDILDRPERTIRSWRRNGIYEAIDRFYDHVLIYGSEEIYDTRKAYGIGRRVRTPVEYCGYICPESGARTKAGVRHDLGLGEHKIAVVTAGGGADGYPMMDLCLDALSRVDPASGLELICITGPFMSQEQVERLRRKSAGLPARVLWSVDQMPSYFAAADILITMAGYNTMLEAMAQAKPTLVLPRRGPSAEQAIRAERLEKRRIVRIVPESMRTPAGLAALMSDCLTAPQPDPDLPAMDGVDRTVRRLLELLEARGLRARLRAVGRPGAAGGDPR